MKHLNTYHRINEQYYTKEKKVFIILNTILQDIFFADKPKFFSLEMWNKNNNFFSGELKLEYVNDENYDTLKQIWDITKQEGKFKISPITQRRLGWYIKIHEDNLMIILENLKELTSDSDILKRINKCVTLLKQLEVFITSNKYNI